MRIFLTGAAGSIGGEVAQRLVARGHAVIAGVHRNREVRGNSGALVPVASHATIDLAAPALGLAESEAAGIAASHDMIIHCAATVRFDLPEAEYEAINVAGTAAVLALATRADLPLLHVSTAYVCGTRDGLIGEADPLPATGFANGYEASKAAAEALVSAAAHAMSSPGPASSWATAAPARSAASIRSMRCSS
ncbi:SDR family oxidoreductase [Novosphingobium sp.]|uniref:SDR family oxidoreductase n=1 Tax=Novosphingobium sp. TaxID=1874826 RepID=UPI0025F37FF4|nr:SDR family oxidoreductase [Novosphingobium sp.]